MREQHAKGATVTFTAVYRDRFLFVQRDKDDPILGGYWGFPGGKVHVGETLAKALERECLEETGLRLTGKAFFVDSYLLGERVGTHFAVEVVDDKVKLAELQDHAWVGSVKELASFAPRIPGIDTHLHYIIEHLDKLSQLREQLADTSHDILHGLGWHSLDQYDLVAERFLNR